jgi:hypothetical protein
LYVERLDCDGANFEHLVEISDCVVGEWSAREAMFTGGLEVSGTRFLNPIDFGTGHSEKIGRFAIGAHSEDTVKFIETQLD